MMRKVKSKNWKKQRYFMLQQDCMTVWYKSKMSGKAKSAFSVSDVETIREGHQSEVLRSLAEEFPAECCFTVVFHGRRSNQDLIASSVEEAQCWIQGLRPDKDNDGRMNFREVQHLLRMMNVDMNEDHAFQLFQMADKSETGSLEGEEFVLFYKALTQRDEVLEIFQEYSEDGKKLTLLEFVDFLQQEQMEVNGTDELAMELIDRYEPSETGKARHILSPEGFLMYLCSPDGSIFNPEHRKIFQDMSQPLCHYFISSSHNTYLIEDQLRGQSSVEGYIRALKRGCRCLEVDCWDGSNGEPIVYHGYTFTSKIPFRDVVTTLEKYAFWVSHYPIILSIENHCSVEQQDIMAQLLKGILGERLLINTIDELVPVQLPSPEKIGYLEDCLNEHPDKMPEREEVTEEEGNEIEEEEALRSEDKRKEKVCGYSPGWPLHMQKGILSPFLAGVLFINNLQLNIIFFFQKGKQSLSKELSDCIIYCKSVPFYSFQHSCSHYKSYEMSSFTESKARKLIRETGNDFVHSSNFNPQAMWNVGCQLVALNFQTAGTEMDLYDGFFSQNGHCGYVLKPSFMRDRETAFSPEDPQSRGEGNPLSLMVKIISGQQLPKIPNSKEGSIVDPFVRVEIHGIPSDSAKQETKYIDNNGFNPQWGESFRFYVWVPELALLRFVVEDYDKTSRNDFVGQYTLPLTSVKEGYRHIHLLSKDGTGISPASLFVHIRIGELATEND
uniref:Phosphoinositide phospholipase C n=1 Tax=Naja naja TaxID=35670 RepID=A0A8C6Y393_NAJNA